MCVPHSRLEYLRKFDRKGNLWLLFFIFGIAIGAFIANHFLSAEPFQLLPTAFKSPAGIAKLLIGGFLIGFGTRYAGGCTSGHSITGLANLNWPSLLATICFFAGGLAVTWGLGNLLF